MAMKVVDLDAHVVAKIFEAAEHVSYKLYVVACVVISQQFLNYQHKSCPSRRFLLDYLASKMRIFHKLPDLWTFKNFCFNFFHTHPWECTA